MMMQRFYSLFMTFSLMLVSTNSFADSITSDSKTIKANMNTTLYGNTYNNHNLLNSSALGLIEFDTSQDSYDLQLGFSWEAPEHEANVNSLMMTYYADDYELQFGKMVTKVGVLDFISSMDVYNPTRPEYYDDENINVRKVPTLLGQLTYYPDDDSTLKFIVAPFDNNRVNYLYESLDTSLNKGIPYLLLNSGNNTIDVFAEPILLPLYENGVKQGLDWYLRGQLPSPDQSIDTTTFTLNYETYASEMTRGLIFTRGFSNSPLVKVDPALTAAVDLRGQERMPISMGHSN